ncbi:CBASS oligonucleotide cyclase [Brevundimonas sp.]|uniref:CBASS oligonucleotide cyclase n=1 Tax=Brevundimonas sp. TaxID=1871086 RepID=UPI002D5DD1FF|nr:CBASS oligonucleotide cyclase [Brevundimonas sp.]HYC97032.1 CBASS oligonucleotide cyclase [Brevundimonas sp.]
MGGSSSGGSNYRGLSSSAVPARPSVEDAAVEAFQTELGELLATLLASYNQRDYALVEKRVEPIVEALCGEYSGSIERLFGGSVAKHTYVDGLSDIDCLITIDGSDLAEHTPGAALRKIANMAAEVSSGATVTVGRMAVTVSFADGMEVQLLPAMRGDDGKVSIPTSDGKGWSTVNPQNFRDALVRRNGECGGKLVPTIKLAKAVLASMDSDLGLSGYHVESLAIEAFRGYSGTKSTAAMLPAFFERARTLVLEPIKDSTGQSIHVDSDLGQAHNEQRQHVSLALGRIARQMRTASAAASRDRWSDFFGLGE